MRTSTRTAAPKRAAAAAKEAKKAFVFFNCDEAKSDHTKNIFYNHEVFRDTGVSRKALWAKVQAEVAAGRVRIDEANAEAAKACILDGDPTEAGQYLHCGAIHSLDCY